MTSSKVKPDGDTEKLRYIPSDWEDDLKMTVMFSPFRDKNLNPKSWDQKIKFWSEFILEECNRSKEAIIDVLALKEKFRRKGKSPACLETVINEMISKGQLKKTADMQCSNTDGWLSWGYSNLVKKPFGWSMKWLSGQQEESGIGTLVVVDVIKDKAKQILEIRNRLAQTETVNVIEYSQLRNQHKELFETDLEFSLVMKELVDSKQVVIQQAEGTTKLVKFIQKDKEKKSEKINEQDIHIHRIQKAHSEVKRQIEILSTEVQKLGSEAVEYKQKGMMKLAISCMRKRKLAQNRIDKLTGSMETLEEILYRIKQAESNEMILKAIEGGASVLKGLTIGTSADDVSNVMDDLADVTQTQDDIMAELNMTAGFIDEPSQSELEDELSDILSENTPPSKSKKPLDVDADIEKELEDILNDSGADSKLVKDDLSKDLAEMLDDLQLPDVPSHSPAQSVRKERQMLTS